VKPSLRSRRPVSALLIALAVVAAGTGCSPLGSSAGGGSTPQVVAENCPGSATPLAELAVVAPKAATGPSTACLPELGIDPIIDSATPKLPVTVTDDDGAEVTVTDASRILPLDITGTIAATVFSLGLGDRVVGRDSSTGFAEAAGLPVVTANGHDLSAEAVLSLEPTVIVTDTTLGSRDVLLQLREAGITLVVVTSERSIDDTGTLIGQVATALGVTSLGTDLIDRVTAETADTIAEIDAIAPADAADRPRVLFLYVRGTANIYYIFGAESGADSLITSLGGIDVATEIGWQGMKPLTAEALVEAAPDVLLVMTKGLESAGGVDGLIERVPAIAATPAGVNRRIVDMADDQILSFGPRTPQVLDALARALYAPGA
jgi:iron complex transport system substrate-binding protein